MVRLSMPKQAIGKVTDLRKGHRKNKSSLSVSKDAKTLYSEGRFKVYQTEKQRRSGWVEVQTVDQSGRMTRVNMRAKAVMETLKDIRVPNVAKQKDLSISNKVVTLFSEKYKGLGRLKKARNLEGIVKTAYQRAKFGGRKEDVETYKRMSKVLEDYRKGKITAREMEKEVDGFNESKTNEQLDEFYDYETVIDSAIFGDIL